MYRDALMNALADNKKCHAHSDMHSGHIIQQPSLHK